MPENIYYVNGDFVPSDKAVIPVTDLAIMRGSGVFETMRTYGGKIFHLEDHVARIERSAHLIGLTLPWTRKQLMEFTQQTLAKNSYKESNVRMVITGGESRDFFMPIGEPGLLIMVMEAKSFAKSLYETGARIALAQVERFQPEAKTIHYIPGQMAMQEARTKCPEIAEVIYVDRRNNITEGITSNIFAFFGATLVTPGRDILLGVTRKIVLGISRLLFKAEERDLPCEDFLKADELFLTSTTKEVMPVISVDGKTIGNGKPGPGTQKVMAAFHEYTERFRANG